MVEEVIRHIKEFPVVKSHYCRENSRREYLEGGLTLLKMYRMYVDKKRASIEGRNLEKENCSYEEKDMSENSDSDNNDSDDDCDDK